VSPSEAPVPFCRLHRGQLADGDQLRRRCHGWSEPLLRLVTPLQERAGRDLSDGATTALSQEDAGTDPFSPIMRPR
jgi:hypothetical protein